MPLRWRIHASDVSPLAAVAAVSSLVLFAGLGNAGLWDRDEGEYAEAVREMAAAGEWLVPTFRGQPFLEKPPMLYWLARSSAALLGPSETALRLPSAVLGVLTCVATYALGAALWDRRAGLFAALVLATSPLFAAVDRLLLADPSLVFFSTTALLFYARCGRGSRCALFLAYAALGGAALAKGPVAFFALPAFAAFEWLTREGPACEVPAAIVRRHALPLSVAVGIAAPWFAHAWAAHPEEMRAFFTSENVERLRRGFEGHGGPVFYYVPVLLLGMLPWSLFLGCAGRRLSPAADRGTLLLAVWIAVPLVVFSLGATKLPHYALPMVPPIACLVGRAFSDASVPPRALARRSLAAVAASVLLACVPAALFVVWPRYASLRLVAPFVPLVLAADVAARSFRSGRRERGFGLLVAGAGASWISFALVALPSIDAHRVTKPIAVALRDAAAPGDAVFAYRFREPSLFFYARRVFPIVKDGSLDGLLARPGRVWVVTRDAALREPIRHRYRVVARREGVAENGGETTLVLLSNDEGE